MESTLTLITFGLTFAVGLSLGGILLLGMFRKG